jgi:hypothetical protein
VSFSDITGRFFDGADTTQIVLAVVVTLAMVWVLWIGARSNRDTPNDPTPPGGPATDA